MKRLLTPLALGLVLVVAALQPSEAQRGDLYGARSLQSLEQAFKTTGVLTFPNYAAAPVTCNAANLGVYYYDTTATEARVCGGAGPAWVGVGGGLTVGTANTIPKWNAVPDDLVDSLLSDDATTITAAGVFESPQGTSTNPTYSFTADNDTGIYNNAACNIGFSTNDFLMMDLRCTNTAGAGAVILEISPTLNIMNGADTVIGFYVDMVSADHVGGPNANTIYGIGVDSIVNDDDTIEYALALNSGFDVDIWGLTDSLLVGSATQITAIVDDTWGQIFTVDSSHAAGGSNTWVEIDANLAIMDAAGGDIVRGLFVDIANANHTGGSVYGIHIDGVVQDDQATEYGLLIGDGSAVNWDEHIYIDSGANATFPAEIGFPSGGGLRLHDGGNAIQLNLRASTAPTFRAQFTGGGGDIDHGVMQLVDLEYTVAAMDNATDTREALAIDVGTANHSAGTVYGINVEGITGDPDSTETAINIAGGWDSAFHHDGMAHAALQAVANGSIVFCTNCDPASTPCTTGGASTGAFAFRVNGQWDCPW